MCSQIEVIQRNDSAHLAVFLELGSHYFTLCHEENNLNSEVDNDTNDNTDINDAKYHFLYNKKISYCHGISFEMANVCIV
jgi:hypothetical protein